MPRILEMKDIKGELWCRVGKPQEFKSGVSLFDPEEVEAKYQEGYRDALRELAENKKEQL